MTALTIPAVANGDNVINSINANFDLVEAALNNLDGGNLNSGSVLNAALAKGKALFAITLCTDRALTADVTGIFSVKMPTVDGGSVTFKYLGASIGVQTLTTPFTAGSKFQFYKNGGASIHDFEVDSAVLTAAATPITDSPAAPVSFASGDLLTVNFDWVTAGSAQYLTLVLYFSLAHVGT